MFYNFVNMLKQPRERLSFGGDLRQARGSGCE